AKAAIMAAMKTPPKPLPLVGHAIHFIRSPLEFIESLRPCGDVVRIRLGTRPVYIVNSPDLIRRILVTEAQSFGAVGLLLEKVRPIIGDGLITLRGADHRRHRRMLQPAFHHESIGRYVDVMYHLAAERADSWHDGQQMVADVEMMELATGIVGKTLFSLDLDHRLVDEVVDCMPVLLEGIRRRLLAPVGLLEKLPT